MLDLLSRRDVDCKRCSQEEMWIVNFAHMKRCGPK